MVKFLCYTWSAGVEPLFYLAKAGSAFGFAGEKEQRQV